MSEPGRGNQDDVPSASGCGGSSERQADAAASVCMLPAGAGFLTAALLQKGILSLGTANGSWYLQDLCEMLARHGSSFEFKVLLVLVNRGSSMLRSDISAPV